MKLREQHKGYDNIKVIILPALGPSFRMWVYFEYFHKIVEDAKLNETAFINIQRSWVVVATETLHITVGLKYYSIKCIQL